MVLKTILILIGKQVQKMEKSTKHFKKYQIRKKVPKCKIKKSRKIKNSVKNLKSTSQTEYFPKKSEGGDFVLYFFKVNQNLMKPIF